jgi:hypothetical protein
MGWGKTHICVGWEMPRALGADEVAGTCWRLIGCMGVRLGIEFRRIEVR